MMKTSFESHLWSVTLENTFNFLSSEYQTLFEASDATVFQAPCWLHEFYQNLIGPLDLTPIIVTVRNDSGDLLALLPCVRQISKGLKIVQPADMGVSDYNCIIVRSDALNSIKNDTENLKRDLFDALAPFDVLFFRKQRADKPQVEDILPNGSMSPCDFDAHEVVLQDDFDAWVLEKLSANFRQANRRKRKKLTAEHAEPVFETVTDRDQIEKALAFIREHRGSRFHDDILKQQAFFDFYLNLACRYAEGGFVQTTTMTIDGELAAAFFGLNHKGRHCYLLGGFLPEKYDRYSIGTLAMMALIEDRTNHGFDVFDFALGDESYKDRFGTEAIKIHNTVYANSAFGKLVSYTYKNAKPLKNFLKQFDPKLH